MTVGTEHEYSINDPHFTALPVSDQILKSISGRFESEIRFGEVNLGKELQKTVLEFVPRTPAAGPAALEAMLLSGIAKFYRVFPDQYHLLGLGMHPALTLDRAVVWDHDEGEYYRTYDRLFNIRQHGWLNIQALQINLSYAGEKDLLRQYNRIRSLLPYFIALAASSPMVEGRLTGTMDNRLVYYRENQKEIPGICNGIIPPRLRSVREYRTAQEEIYAQLRARDAGILCEEWLNSSGLIIRFSRGCLEIKALDEQECVRSDMAFVAFVSSLLRCPALPVETDQDALLALTEAAIGKGTAGLREELEALYRHAWQEATAEERQYLPVIRHRIDHGSLAEQMAGQFREEQATGPVLAGMARCLRQNKPYGMR
ncbi:glutamate-cysteine ligase family protein [Methanoregula sp.]|uniref:glutamate-cysteine ligase family protein n=1 Tax=Methanoregula sp. TaxID=2052170 RepID=UPI002BA64685|nr:glutamate-cysteine ligase family protein [Methanoregula sp.]HVP95534.1 glutamate-cysteine ligase family protein [Methanoregula sp.]